MKYLILFAICLVFLGLSFDVMTISKSCDYECDHGSCSYKSCHPAPNCPGGGCVFVDSSSPSCSGMPLPCSYEIICLFSC
jgi:hypothetical protein